MALERVRCMLPGRPRMTTTTTAAAAAGRTAYRPLLSSAPCPCRCLHTRSLAIRWRSLRRVAYSTDAPAAAADQPSLAQPGVAQPGVVSWSTLAQRSRDQQQLQQQYQQQDDRSSPSDPARPQPSPGAILIEHLDRDLASPSSPAAVSTASSTSLSALVEPARKYRHPAETHQSRHRHRQSVVRQARLEAIRQAQLRPLPDWRAMLRLLVAHTPRDGGAGGGYEERFFFRVSPSLSAPRPLTQLPPSLSRLLGTRPAHPLPPSSLPHPPTPWHRNGMSFALPDGSPSVDELLHGTDGSLWAIRQRTGSYLELYRRSPGDNTTAAAADADADDDDDRPWLLTLSGTKIAVQRAGDEVTRFAKDAVPVVVSPDVQLNSRRRSKEILDQSATPDPPDDAADAAEDDASSPPLSSSPLPSSSSPSHQPPQPPHVWNLVTSAHPDNNPKARDDPVFHPYTIHHSAYAIPRPDTWTRESLDRYIAALVNSRPAPHLAAALYAEKPDSSPEPEGDASRTSQPTGHPRNNHDRAVLALCHAALGDPAARHALSVSAFQRALAFACARGEAHRPDARALFMRMEAAGLPADTQTFNLLLASQVQTQDLRNFGATLLLMRGRGQPPDLGTWLQFLRVFASEEVKRHILHAMVACGLLDSAAAVWQVAPEMVHHDAERALARAAVARAAGGGAGGGDNANVNANTNPDNANTNPDNANADDPAFLAAFLAASTARYGRGWLTRKAAHRLLHVLGRHSRWADCHRVLALLETWHPAPSPAAPPPSSLGGEGTTVAAVQPPNTHSYNTVLYHCAVQNSLRHGLDVVDRMGASGATGLPVADPGVPPPPSSFVATPSTAPDDVTFHHLFDLAWLRRLPHMLGVVWHAACVARRTTHRMRQRVGRVLVGDGPSQTAVLAKVFAPDAPDAPSDDTSPHPGHTAANRLAAQYAGWTPAAPLGPLLREALARDNAWLRARARARRKAMGQAVEAAAGGEDEPEPSWSGPMRIPLRRVQEQKQGHPDEGPSADDNERYIEIRVD